MSRRLGAQGCRQVHRRDPSKNPKACGPCGQPSHLTRNTVASLRPLRRRWSGLVRGLHWYFGPVRLPELVHRRRASLDFPTRPAAPSAAGKPRTSRFSCEVFPYVHGVSDRAGPGRIS